MPEAQLPTQARRRWGRWLVLAMAVLVAAADVYVLAATRARRLGLVADAPAEPYAMVLGNQVFSNGTPSRELACRLETGRQLYAAGRAGRLIVSGAAHPELDYDEPAAMATWLEAHGVPRGDLVLDRGGYRTAASMADAAASGVRSLLVVSQGYHLPRALYLAGHAGLDAWGVAAVCQGHRNWMQRAQLAVRETAARVETIVEVLVRGVRGKGAPAENSRAHRVAKGDPLG